jgi:YesN/AraC family two-component response regulator
LGVLAKNTLRNSKNLGIVLVTLASRAAIEGGVIPEEAYTLSDNFIQKIEECQDSDTVLSTARQAEYYYCRMVNKVHEEKTSTPRKKSLNRWVNYCKDYIFSHLHDKITVAEIADEIHINANYLSGIFKEYEGISIREFIIREKVKLAQNMLIYSDYSYIEIAAYLGFSSQSHLGKHFKNITGKTMHQYREEYGVVKEKAYTS